MLMTGFGSDDARSKATVLPTEEDSDRISGVSDIREILRPAGVPSLTESPGFEPSTDTIAVDEGPLGAPRDFPPDSRQRMLLVLSGSLTLTSEALEEAIELRSGEATWMTPGDAFRISPKAPTRVCVVATNRPVSIPDNGNPLRDAAGRLRELVQWLTMELRSEFAGADTYRNTLLELLASEWTRLSCDDMGVLEKRLRAYVLQHIDEPITLEAVARHVGVGRYHLCRKYRRATGQSPMHAVRGVRLEQARELLATTRLPLRVVARRVGLSSEQHLSRLLRAHFGIGVREIRQKACGED